MYPLRKQCVDLLLHQPRIGYEHRELSKHVFFRRLVVEHRCSGSICRVRGKLYRHAQTSGMSQNETAIRALTRPLSPSNELLEVFAVDMAARFALDELAGKTYLGTLSLTQVRYRLRIYQRTESTGQPIVHTVGKFHWKSWDCSPAESASKICQQLLPTKLHLPNYVSPHSTHSHSRSLQSLGFLRLKLVQARTLARR